MNCRFCKNLLEYELINLGMTPLANSYLSQKNLHNEEKYYPLSVMVCNKCFLVQLSEDATSPENIFSDYAYFSSYSKIWLKHAESYADMISEKIRLGKDSLVIELASNDGYLLQYFKNKEIPVLGIDPAENIAKVAKFHGALVPFMRPAELSQDHVWSRDALKHAVVGQVITHCPILSTNLLPRLSLSIVKSKML